MLRFVIWLSDAMTTGIVSEIGRSLPTSAGGGFSIPNAIQTDAPINPDNSGGPLLIVTMPIRVVLVLYTPSSIDLLQQLMLQLLSSFGSYFSKLILLFSVYIGCFTATAKIIREIVDILIHYNSIRNNAC
jgi:hypothetical protein